MYLIGVCVCALFVVVSANQDNVTEIDKGRGFDIGGGLSVHLDNIKSDPDASILEKYALRLDYDGIGMRIGKAEKQDAFKVGIYFEEGRGRRRHKLNDLIVPALLGFKSTSLAIMGITGIGILVMKAFMVAKIAVVVAAILVASKLLKKEKKSEAEYGIELDHHPSEMHSVYADYPSDELGYAQTASGQYVAYAAHVPEGSDLSSLGSAVVPQYQYVSPSNASDAIQIVKRRDSMKRKKPMKSYITVKRKSTVVN